MNRFMAPYLARSVAPYQDDVTRRYDKHTVNDRGTVVLAAIFTWRRA